MISRSCSWTRRSLCNLGRSAAAVPRTSRAVAWASSGRSTLVFVLVAVLVSVPAPVAAQASGPLGDEIPESAPAVECCLVLLLPVGARAVSLGGTLAARPSLDAVFANPAGLVGVDDDHFVVHHATSVAGQANAFSLLLATDGLGTFGVSYQLFDFGEIEMTDEQGTRTGTLSLRDHLFVASYGTHLIGGIVGGVNYKVYHSRIGCRGACGGQQVAATTHALDLGMQYHPSWFPSLRVGAAVTNAGFALQVVNAEQADPLPTRATMGIAFDVLRHVRADSTVALWLAVELEDRWASPGNPVASVGAELSADRKSVV